MSHPGNVGARLTGPEVDAQRLTKADWYRITGVAIMVLAAGVVAGFVFDIPGWLRALLPLPGVVFLLLLLFVRVALKREAGKG